MQIRLLESSLFRDLSQSEFSQLFVEAVLVECTIGTVLSSSVAPTDSIYILLHGKLRVLVADIDGSERTMVMLTRTGEFYCQPNEDSVSAINLRASAPTTVIQIPLRSLKELLQNKPRLAEQLKRESDLLLWQATLSATLQFKLCAPQHMRSILRCCQLTDALPTETSSAFAIALKDRHLSTIGARPLQDSVVNAINAVTACTPGSTFWIDGREPIERFPSLDIALPAPHFSLGDLEVAGPWLVLPRSSAIELAQQEMECIRILFEAARRTAASNDLHASGAPADSRSCASSTLLSQRLCQLPNAAVPGLNKKVPLEREPPLVELRRRWRKYPHLFQQSNMDCGAACLVMIAMFYGKRPSLNQVKELCQVSAYGTSLLAMAEASERLGFIAQGIQANYEGLRQIRLPCVCFWKGNHFVVLYEIDQKKAVIGDPAEGLLTIGRQIFNHHFSGAALEIYPTAEFGSKFASSNPLFSLLPLFSHVVPSLRDILLASFLLQTLLLAVPIFTQVVVDKVVVHHNLPMLTLMLIGMAICCLFETLLSLIRGYLLSFVAIKLDQALIVQFYKHLLSLPLKFFEERSTGALVSRFAENQKIRDLLTGSSVTVLLDSITVVAYLLLICCYNATFALAAVSYVFLFFVVVVFYTPILKKLGLRVFNKQVESQSFLIESIHGIEKIKSASVESHTRWKWEILFTDTLNLQFQQLVAINLTNCLSKLIHMAGQICLLWVGATLVISDKLTIGQFMALNMMVEMVVQPVIRLVEIWDKLQEASIAVERIADVLESEPEESAGERSSLGTVSGAVKFESVTFRYTNNDSSNTLSNVSFAVPPGLLVAIVGRSGSGKSTILKLIQALYLPVSGRVVIDGIDTAHVSLKDLRSRIGVVAQNEFFFRGTIRENLSLYHQSATRDEIVKAAEIAGIHEFITSLPMEYQTPLTEGGFNLSGGQRQRLAIARAILHNPSILIFDEATSALDSESERRIQESMKRVRIGRTMFVVAHRLSTVRDADTILVIDRGQIVEAGTHDELVDQRGLYHYLCSQQLSL